jgi:hypothetical protein
MKKLIPYILAYLIVAVGTAAFAHFTRHTPSILYPPNSVTVITTLSHDELAAKLQQVGLPETPPMRTMTVGPSHLSLPFHFAFYAIILAVFAGLTFFVSASYLHQL